MDLLGALVNLAVSPKIYGCECGCDAPAIKPTSVHKMEEYSLRHHMACKCLPCAKRADADARRRTAEMERERIREELEAAKTPRERELEKEVAQLKTLLYDACETASKVQSGKLVILGAVAAGLAAGSCTGKRCPSCDAPL